MNESGDVARTSGWVAPGFQLVRTAFEQNFQRGCEMGAAFAAVLDGDTIVDLWGGQAAPESGRPWEKDTLQIMFSGTKGLVALCVLMLVDRAAIALEDPVCKHWPEFATNGKRGIRVADVLAHRARMPAISEPLAERDILDADRLATMLAGQSPETDPRANASYHPLTYGWLCGELVRRVSGQSVGSFFDEHVARPLGLDLWIGLPGRHEARVAQVSYGPDWGRNPVHDEDELAGDALLRSVLANPPLFPADRIPWNDAAFHAAEIPAINAIGTARSVARLYGCLARGGELGGVRLISADTLVLGRRELSRFDDPWTGSAMAYGSGFQLQTETARFGPATDAFGHPGAGGSVHAAWPTERIGVSYVMNELHNDRHGDPRPAALLRALHQALTQGTTTNEALV